MERLESILSKLSYLNLENDIVDKQPYASELGGSCDVYSAWSTRHNKKVAVKQLRAFLRKDVSLAKRLVKEIRIWAKLDHVNILPFLGYFAEGESLMPSLVSEWMVKGTLYDFMKTFPKACQQTRLILRGIASGLAYLHLQAVIHADLKSHNIMISDRNEPLIADFGLSLALSQSLTGSTTGHSDRGTVRWMARKLLVPEAGFARCNEATDIWAYGMVAYELLTWKVPFWNKPKDIYVLVAIMQGELPEKPEESSDAKLFDILWKICESCWKSAEDRPTALQIADELSAEDLDGAQEQIRQREQQQQGVQGGPPGQYEGECGPSGILSLDNDFSSSFGAGLSSAEDVPSPAGTFGSGLQSHLGRAKLRALRSTFVPGWAVPPRVLLVDSDAVNRRLSSKFFQVLGCNLDVAVDGVVAVKKMNLEKYDLVLMEIVMPKLDGITATSMIRQFDHMTPIIAMTANRKPNEIVTFKPRGMNDFLSKPFTKEQLFVILERHLSHLKGNNQEASKRSAEREDPATLDRGDHGQALVVSAQQQQDLDNEGRPRGPLATPEINPLARMGLSDEEYNAMLQHMVSGSEL